MPDESVLNAVNWKIRDVAANCAGLADSPVEFVCTCGCGEEVVMTIEEYDSAGGAWVEGHSRLSGTQGSEAA